MSIIVNIITQHKLLLEISMSPAENTNLVSLSRYIKQHPLRLLNREITNYDFHYRSTVLSEFSLIFSSSITFEFICEDWQEYIRNQNNLEKS